MLVATSLLRCSAIVLLVVVTLSIVPSAYSEAGSDEPAVLGATAPSFDPNIRVAQEASDDILDLQATPQDDWAGGIFLLIGLCHHWNALGNVVLCVLPGVN